MTELTRIRVRNPAKRESRFVFPSVMSAVDSHNQNLRRLSAEQEGEFIRGSVVQAFEYGNDAVRFSLTGNVYLNIWLDGGIPRWRVASRSEQVAPLADMFPETMVLEWERVAGVWPRRALLEQRVGLPVALLSAGMVDVLLYVEGLCVLRFSPMIAAETGECFLYWSEVD